MYDNQRTEQKMDKPFVLWGNGLINDFVGRHLLDTYTTGNRFVAQWIDNPEKDSFGEVSSRYNS